MSSHLLSGKGTDPVLVFKITLGILSGIDTVYGLRLLLRMARMQVG